MGSTLLQPQAGLTPQMSPEDAKPLRYITAKGSFPALSVSTTAGLASAVTPVSLHSQGRAPQHLCSPRAAPAAQSSAVNWKLFKIKLSSCFQGNNQGFSCLCFYLSTKSSPDQGELGAMKFFVPKASFHHTPVLLTFCSRIHPFLLFIPLSTLLFLVYDGLFSSEMPTMELAGHEYRQKETCSQI